VRWLVLIAATACRIGDVDLTGKQCPCPGGWSCQVATGTCVRGGAAGDAPAPSDALVDAPGEGPAGYRDVVLADQPIAYWRLGDTDGTARDELGHYDGTYSGACMHGVAGIDGNGALGLDGRTCEVVLPDALEFPNTEPYAVEAWIEEPGPVTAFRVVFSKESRNMGPVDGYALVDSSTGAYFERAILPSAPTTAHEMHAFGSYVHLVGVYDGASFVMYVDGQPGQAVADARAMPTYSADALIGADLDGDFFTGSLDEVAIYDHVLAADRIALHYAIGSGSHD